VAAIITVAAIIMVPAITGLAMDGGDRGVTTQTTIRATTLTTIHPTTHTRPQSYCHCLSSASVYIERQQDEPEPTHALLIHLVLCGLGMIYSRRIRISTLLFSNLPFSVLLSAIGFNSPRPNVEIRDGLTPASSTRYCFTA
jgi:hypothetical protein